MAFTFPFQSGLQNNSDLLLSVGAGLLGGRTPQEQGALAAAGAAQTIGTNRKRNKTAELLRQQGSTELADAVEAGSLNGDDAYKLFYSQKLEAAKPKQNFMAVGKNLYNAATGEWVTPPAGLSADAPEYGLNPVWGKNGNGDTVLGQLGKDGSFHQLDTPGFTPTPVLQNLDTGTAIISQNSRTGQVVGSTPKNLAQAAQQTAEGKIQGETAGTASGALPAAKQAAQTISQQVEELKNDSYLPSMLGPVNSRLPNFTSDAARVQGKIEQLKGGAFLQARQMLKGGGAITDFEGQKAEQAYTRMQQAQSVPDFNAALDDYNQAVQNGLAILQQQAGSGAMAAPTGGKGGRTATGIQFSVGP